MSFLGGIGDFLLGEGPEVDTTQLPTMTPEQKALLDQIITLIGEGNTTPAGGLGPSQIELSSLAGLEGLINQVPGANNPSGAAATETSGNALDALNEILGSDPQDIEAFFNATVQDPLLEQFEEDILPRIQTRFAPQFFGGERRDAEGKAREDLIESLVKARAGISFGARESDLNRKVTAAGTTPSVAGSAASVPFVGASNRANILLSILGAGGTEAGIEQRQLDERNRRIREALAASGLPAFENLTTIDPGQEGLVQSVIANFAGAAGTSGGSAAGGKAAASIFG